MIKSILVAVTICFATSALASEPVDPFRFGPGPHMLDPLVFNHKQVKNPKHSRDRATIGKKSIAAAKSTPRPELQTHEKAAVVVAGAANDVVTYARSQIGNGAIYGRRSLWCARFMNTVLERTGHKGTGSDMARDFASYGTRISGPKIGAIVVMGRGKHGGHVGVVSGIDKNGNPIIISGNHSRRVAESVYPKGRIYAYVLP